LHQELFLRKKLGGFLQDPAEGFDLGLGMAFLTAFCRGWMQAIFI
jgi:hypothetical protein